MELKFSRLFSKKYSNVNCNESPFIGNGVVPCVQTDGQMDGLNSPFLQLSERA